MHKPEKRANTERPKEVIPMSMDTNLPASSVEQEEAEHIVRNYAKSYKDVAYTNPETGKTGFTAMTLDGHFVVSFGLDQTPGHSGWYYSVAAEEDYAHSAKGSGMAHAGQAEHLIKKIVEGETWYSTHEKEVHGFDKAIEEHQEEFSEGVVGIHKDADGMYPTEA